MSLSQRNAEFMFEAGGGPRGMMNLGNTCYVNSVGQALLSFPAVIDVFMGLDDTQIRKGTPHYGLVASSFGPLLREMVLLGKEAFDSSDFLLILKHCWPAYVDEWQMDAAEFFSFLMDALHEDLRIEKHRVNEGSEGNEDVFTLAERMWKEYSHSPISLLVYMQVITVCTCSSCLSTSGQFRDVSNHLAVQIPPKNDPTLKECLDSFFAIEDLPDSKCRECLNVGRTHRQILGRLPSILVIHLKRFKSLSHGTTKKIMTTVTYDDTLDMSPYIMESVRSNTMYELVGVINHHGPSLSQGHYISIMKRGDRWYRFDDSKVTSCTSRKVLSSSAYLLFYQMKNGERLLPVGLPLTPLTERRASPDNFDLPPSVQETDKNLLYLPPNGPEVTHSDDTLSGDVFDGRGSEEKSDTFMNDSIAGCSHDYFDGPTSDHDGMQSQDMFPDIFPNTVDPPTMSEDPDDVGLQDSLGEVITNHERLGDVFAEDPDDPSRPSVNPPLEQRGSSSQDTACQHPNYDLDVMDPILSPEDVPGATLDMDSLANATNKDLKRWLECRELPRGGTKAELMQRILNHRHKADKIAPGVDGGKWYERKRKILMEQAAQTNKRFPFMPAGFAPYKAFPSVHIPNNYSAVKAREYLELIPSIRFSYECGIEKSTDPESEPEDVEKIFSLPSQHDRKSLFVDGTLKRSNIFIRSGRVLRMSDCERNDHYFLKADVQASMEAKIYIVSIMISKSSGNVCFAECCCKARALGRCCHIMSALLLVARHVDTHGHEATTTTGRRCYWVVPGSSTTRNPGVIREKDEYYPKVKFQRRGHFDPRPTSHQVDRDASAVQQLFNDLESLSITCLWSLQLLDEPLLPEENFPDVETTVQIADKCSYLQWKLNQIRLHSNSQPLHFPKTHGQCRSESWYSERAVRLTASEAKTVLGLSNPTSMMKFLRRHVWGLDRFENEAMRRGRDLESEGRRAYTAWMKSRHPLWDVLESGLWSNPLYPQLACSPDGLVVCVNGVFILLEIKWPAVLIDMDPNDFEDLPRKQLANFCLRRNKETGEVELKPTHKWHYQVQMSLDILKLQKCHFVVCSSVSSVTKFLKVDVFYDETFWKEKRERLIRIHREWLVPELFMCNAKARRPPQRLMYTPFHEECNDEYFKSAFTCGEPIDSICMEVENEGEFLLHADEE